MCFVSVVFFKQKTAYELRISDWSSDVCSSDLPASRLHGTLSTWSNTGCPCPDPDGGPSGLSSEDGTGFEARPDATRNKTSAKRSEASRGGKEGGSTCTYRCAAYHENKNIEKQLSIV